MLYLSGNTSKLQKESAPNQIDKNNAITALLLADAGIKEPAKDGETKEMKIFRYF